MNNQTLFVVGAITAIVGTIVWANVLPRPAAPQPTTAEQVARANENLTSSITANERYTVFPTSLGDEGNALVIFDNNSQAGRILRKKDSAFFYPRFVGSNRSDLIFTKIDRGKERRELVRCETADWRCRIVFTFDQQILTPELLTEGTYAFTSSPRVHRERRGWLPYTPNEYIQKNIYVHDEKTGETRKVTSFNFYSTYKLISLSDRLILSGFGPFAAELRAAEEADKGLFERGVVVDKNTYEICLPCEPKRSVTDGPLYLSDIDAASGFRIYTLGYPSNRQIIYFDSTNTLRTVDAKVTERFTTVSHGALVGSSRVDFFLLPQHGLPYVLMTHRMDEGVTIKRGEVKVPAHDPDANFVELDTLMAR